MRWHPSRRSKPTPAAAGAAVEPLSWTAGSSLMARAARIVLLGWLVVGAAAVVVLASQVVIGGGNPPVRSADSAVPRTAGEQAAVEAFAERYVVAWLAGTNDAEAVLEAYVDLPDATVLPDRGVAATDPEVSNVDRVAEGRWSVTVSAIVGGIRRYYLAPVSYTDGALAAEALPAPVAAPDRATSPSLAYVDDIPTTTPVGQTVSDFVAGLLAGQGDVDRYLTPGTTIRPVSPAPFASIQLVELVAVDAAVLDPGAGPATDGEQLQVLATVVGTGRQRQLTSQYALTLTARDGRWEVTTLNPAPETEPIR